MVFVQLQQRLLASAMNNQMTKQLPAMVATAIVLLSVAVSNAQQDLGIDIGVQQKDGKLITGAAGPAVPTPVFPVQIYTRDFGDNLRTRDPGFFSFGEGSSALVDGLEALPASQPLQWDFLPMTVDGTVSNLLYWDGLDGDMSGGIDVDDVEMNPSMGVEFELNNTNTSGGAVTFVDGGSEMVVGGSVVTTASSGALQPGALHHHGRIRVRSSDGSDVPEGVYLASWQFRIEGVEASDPIFLAMRTFEIDSEAESAARTWIEDNLDMLLGEEPIPGDYDASGEVDASDYALWRQQFGTTVGEPGAGADGTGDGLVEASDYALWRENLPQPASAAIATPEPASLPATLVMGFIAAAYQRKSRHFAVFSAFSESKFAPKT